MFETQSLLDSVILSSKDHTLSRLRANGSRLFTFEFDDLSEQTALTLLASAEAETCRRFYASWRFVRRKMDIAAAVQEAGGGRR